MAFAKDPNEVGALWEKTGKAGTYFTGKIHGEPVVVFKVRDKRPDSNGPDWRVLKPTKQAPRRDEPVEVYDGPVPDDEVGF